MNRKKNIHRGELLASVIEANNVNISQMCLRMGISRGTYYNHIERADLPLELLEEYGKVIRYDFSQDIPGMHHSVAEEPAITYGTPKTIQEAIEQRDYWRDKYYKLLDKLVNDRG